MFERVHLTSRSFSWCRVGGNEENEKEKESQTIAVEVGTEGENKNTAEKTGFYSILFTTICIHTFMCIFIQIIVKHFYLCYIYVFVVFIFCAERFFSYFSILYFLLIPYQHRDIFSHCERTYEHNDNLCSSNC